MNTPLVQSAGGGLAMELYTKLSVLFHLVFCYNLDVIGIIAAKQPIYMKLQSSKTLLIASF